MEHRLVSPLVIYKVVIYTIIDLQKVFTRNRTTTLWKDNDQTIFKISLIYKLTQFTEKTLIIIYMTRNTEKK